MLTHAWRAPGQDKAAAVDLDELCRLAARQMIAVTLKAERRSYLLYHSWPD